MKTRIDFVACAALAAFVWGLIVAANTLGNAWRESRHVTDAGHAAFIGLRSTLR